MTRHSASGSNAAAATASVGRITSAFPERGGRVSSSAAIFPPTRSESAVSASAGEHADLVVDLGAADDCDERALGRVDEATELAQLGLEQQAGVGRKEVSHSLGGRVRAVRRSERVVDVEIHSACSSLQTPGRWTSHRDRSACSRAHGSGRRAAARASAPRREPYEDRDRRLSVGRDANRPRRGPHPGRAAGEASAALPGCACRRPRGRLRAGRSGRPRTSTRLSWTSASRTERGVLMATQRSFRTTVDPRAASVRARSDHSSLCTRSTSRQLYPHSLSYQEKTLTSFPCAIVSPESKMDE